MKVKATVGPRPACRRRLLRPRVATDRLPLVTVALSWALLLIPSSRPVEAAPFASGTDLQTAVDNCLTADPTGACD
eukprot:scaffold5405_cov229-Prasinococcus_capsulatus_cf.AAC.2